jgi:glycolate oxidase iron-sulfur subunit
VNAPLPVISTSASSLQLDPRTYARALSCVHCGLCLPACPTYVQTGNEADSPRGRIQLMRGLSDGTISPTPTVQKHLDLCLDCRGCESACPSGVIYHELIEETRTKLQSTETLTAEGRFMRWLFFNVFVNPTRLKIALLPARLLQKAGVYKLLRKIGLMKLLPPQLQKMEQMLPAEGSFWPRRVASRRPSPGIPGEGVKRVAVFQGCIGQVMFDRVNQMAAELLSASGAEVSAPRAETCCGAIHHHNGDHHTAAEMARRNIDAFMPMKGPQPDVIVTNIAGCGAMLKDYDVLLRDDPAYADRAQAFVAKVRDISEVLLELPLPDLKHPVNATVTYHDACHLAHAQKVSAPPRLLLLKVPGLKMVMLPESDLCCGAAGTYNLTQPQMATSLAERKLTNIDVTTADICAAANVGCAMQIQSHADATGRTLKVLHPVELLHAAAFGSKV